MEEDKKQSRPEGRKDESAQNQGKERKKALIDIIKQADGIKGKLKELLDKL